MDGAVWNDDGRDADGNAANRAETYTIIAVPATSGTTGTRCFFTDQSGVIRQNTTAGCATAAVTDLPIS